MAEGVKPFHLKRFFEKGGPKLQVVVTPKSKQKEIKTKFAPAERGLVKKRGVFSKAYYEHEAKKAKS